MQFENRRVIGRERVQTKIATLTPHGVENRHKHRDIHQRCQRFDLKTSASDEAF